MSSENVIVEATPRSGAESDIVPVQATRSGRGRLIALLVLLSLAVAAFFWYRHSLRFEETDDAQVDGHLVPIASRVEGTIQTVTVEDNQRVLAGQLLVQLDPRDNQVALDQAKAQYTQASAQASAASPNLPIAQISSRTDIASAKAQVAGAQAALAGATQDLAAAIARLKQSQAVNDREQANFKRYQMLFDKHEVAQADYDQYKSSAAAQVQTIAANEAAVEAARRTVDQKQAQLNLQQSALGQSESSAPLRVAIQQADIKTQQANAQSAQAALEHAMLNLQYGKIVAPAAGVITQRNAEPGQHTTAGQQLMLLVANDDLWVTANFKETQLARMHPGQPVTIFVDALHRDFTGKVESMPAITGSRTSMLPPENATGNYVKVIQRMPVRLRFDRNQEALDKLRPGMSVEPKVRVE